MAGQRDIRRLRGADIFCIGLNAIVGSGIFLFPGKLAAAAGPASVAAFAACGLLLMPVALCYAEMGAMVGESGAAALYSREAFGERVGYGVGVIAWAASVLSWAAVASALGGQVGYFIPLLDGPTAGRLLAAGSILAFGALNYRGIEPGSRAVNILTVAKLLPLGFFALVGLSALEPGRFSPFFSGERSFGRAVFLALWALQGFEVVGVPAGEARTPQRDVPRAVIGSLSCAVVLYCLIQAAAVGSFPGLHASLDRPLADAAGHLLGPWGGALLAAAGAVSMTGFLAGEALGAPRFLSSLGSASLSRLRLCMVHERFLTPYRAIAATTGAGAALALTFDFSRLIDLSNLAVVCQYVACCLAVLALRVRRPGAERPYKVPCVWLVAPAGCAVSAWLMTQVSWPEAAGSAAVLMAGYLVKAWVDKRRS
ncbi:MAG: APC family permease [Elusimicrobiota bacterium]